jgi:hypothetical protein
MDPTELHTKAVIAAALITSHAVAVPSLPHAAAARGGADHEDAVRLRELIDYVYEVIVGANASAKVA